MAVEDTPLSITFESSSSSLTILMATNSSNDQAHHTPTPTVLYYQAPLVSAQPVYQAQQSPSQPQLVYNSTPVQPHPDQGLLGLAPTQYGSQPTTFPSAFSTMPLQDPTWHMDTGASSHLNFNASNLSTIFDKRLFPSVYVGDGNTSHSNIPSIHHPFHLHNVLVTPNIIKNLISVRQFTRDNNCTIEFDAFGFSVKDFLTRHILLRCDSSGDLYPVTKPSTTPTAFLSTSASTWHQRLGHPGDEVLRSLVSSHFISCNKDNYLHICYACQLGKHVKLPFHSSNSIVEHCFDIIHSDLWTSPILFKHKFHIDGTLSRYKARMVANGSSQQLGIDFDETFSPVVKPDTIRTVLSLAVFRQWPIYQFDVKNAFLNGDLSETVYMHQPPGSVDFRYPHHVCILQKSLYGLKQAPRAWFQRFSSYATRAGFSHSRCDSSLFIYTQGSQVAYLLIYVDDIILTASSPILLQQIIDSLHKEFDMTDLGALNYFLGISTVRHSTSLFLSQKKYALQLLERAHMVHCNPSRTLVDTETKLGLDGVPVQDPTLYRSLAGALQYLTFTRLDLSYAVHQICLYMHDPREPHFAALKRVLRYVKGTMDLGLHLYASAATSLVGYTDADWAGCPSTRSAVYMSTNPVQHQRTKHIEIDIHFVRDMVKAGHVRVLHVPSRFQYADIFTKGLPSALFEDFRSNLSVRPPPAQTARAY
ncbi:ribonuclease H-like domain-containing protein [Tanacetum coccineum]